MASILYYSKHCGNCNKLLKTLSKSDIKNSMHFLSIDKRIQRDGKIYILLENGSTILLPKIVTSVPTFLNKQKPIHRWR